MLPPPGLSPFGAINAIEAVGGVMAIDFRERGRWLARNLLPHEPMLRARLCRTQIYGLEVDDIIQEVYARIVSQPSLEAIRYPRQYAIQTANAIVIDHIRRLRVVPIH